MNSSQRPLLLMMIATMVIFGLALIYFTTEFLTQMAEPEPVPSQTDPLSLSVLFLAVTMLAAMPAVGMGAYVMYIGSRIRLTRQWPPAGMGFRSETAVQLGSRAPFISLCVMGLGLILIACGFVLPVFAWQMGNLLVD